MNARKALSAAVFLILSVPALAQPIEADPRWQAPPEAPITPYPDRPPQRQGPDWSPGAATYIGLRGSYAFNANTVTTYGPGAPGASFNQQRASYGTGGGFSAFLGTRLPLNLRLELEALFRYQPISRLAVNGVNVPVSGDTRIGAPMLNLLWDVPMPDEFALQPFVGMGVGAAYTRTSLTSPGNIFTSQNRWDLAYSFMAGFGLPLDDTSRLTAMYRFMQVRDAGHKCAAAGLVQSACLTSDVNASTVDLGYEMDL